MEEYVKLGIVHDEVTEYYSHPRKAHLLQTIRRIAGQIKGEDTETGALPELCGARGSCGGCRVIFRKGATTPTAADRRIFTPEQLRQGYRLSCMSRPQTDCEILLDFRRESSAGGKGIEVVTGYGFPDAVSGKHTGGAGQRDSDADDAAGVAKPPYLIAIDLGTTTIAMQLVEAVTGRVLDNYRCLNPQRSFGADVVSRILAAADEGNRALLQRSVREAVLQGIRQFYLFVGENKLCKPKLAVLSGNTTMEHFFLGYDVTGLGVSPFIPETLKEVRLPAGSFPEFPGLSMVVMPGISAFVGGDIVSGLYACGLHHAESGGDPDENIPGLLIDLGTNGELALDCGGRILCTAAAAGPAFEGGPGVDAPGTDMISAAAGLLEQGKMDETGLLREPWFTEGVRSRGVLLNQKDIRQLQTAKAAVRCGMELLVAKADIGGWRRVRRIYLAGGFGCRLSVSAAVRIGLVPEKLKDRVTAVGNTSLMGACSYARALLCPKETPPLSPAGLAERAEAFNLAEQPEFEKEFIKYLNFAG